MLMKNKALIKVFAAIFLAIAAGFLSGPEESIFGVTYLEIYTLIGQLFFNALTLVVVPLVASSIITGSARMSSDGSFGTLGIKTSSYFILTIVLAVTIGLVCVKLIEPGVSQNVIGLEKST